jgi:membrane protein DedA with SNARE-associated domain
MVTNLFQLVMALHGWPVYVVVFALAFLEAAAFLGLVLRGETRTPDMVSYFMQGQGGP